MINSDNMPQIKYMPNRYALLGSWAEAIGKIIMQIDAPVKLAIVEYGIILGSTN